MKDRWRTGPRLLVPIFAALVAAAVGAGCAGPSPTPPVTNPSPPHGSLPTHSAPAATDPLPTPPAQPSPPAAGTDAPSGARLHGLLLLAGRPGAMGLELIGDRGARRPVPLPDPAVAWLSSSLDGRLLATTLDGRAFVSQSIVADVLPAWRRLSPAGIDPTALAGPLAFGSLAPDGTRAAFIAADYRTSAPAEIVVVPLDGSAASVVGLQRSADGAPPSWIDRRLVILTRTAGDQVGSRILDPIEGTHAGGPGPPGPSGPAGKAGWIEPIAGLSIAADGSTLAVASTDDGRIEVHPAGAWLAGARTTPEPVRLGPERDGSRSFAWLAISAMGDRLAVVRTDGDGDSVAMTLHDRATGWAQGRRVALPVGADRAMVAWLP
jgi:lipoprotein LpqB-like beta-propeller protein